MDLYFQGQAWLNMGITPAITARSRSFFERALAADPNNIEALVGSARADAIAGANLFATDPTSAFAAAEAKLIKALSSVRDHPHAHVLLGFVEICTKRAVEGIAECEHALTFDPNLAHAHAGIGFGKILTGRAEETAAHIGEALRLSPRDTMAYAWMNFGAWRISTSAVTSKPSCGVDVRSRPTEIIRSHIFTWPPPSRSLTDWTTRIPLEAMQTRTGGRNADRRKSLLASEARAAPSNAKPMPGVRTAILATFPHPRLRRRDWHELAAIWRRLANLPGPARLCLDARGGRSQRRSARNGGSNHAP